MMRQALMTSIWYKHFSLRKINGEEILYFQLKTIGKTIDAFPRNVVPINFFSPTSMKTRGGTTLNEDKVIELPIVPLSVLRFTDGDGHGPDK